MKNQSSFYGLEQEHLFYMRALAQAYIKISAHPIIIDIEEYIQSSAYKKGQVNEILKSASETTGVTIGFNLMSFRLFSSFIGVK
ncbi:MAG TPA: hypothetical protein DC049_04300 [Spirochaetia bacterium]|nr:hypothetical protein [Spirochaetia bacterium]